MVESHTIDVLHLSIRIITIKLSAMTEKHSKTKTSFYRRLYVSHLIATGVHTVPAISEAAGMHRRTVQDTILALHELGIECVFIGEKKNGNYEIKNWGPINKKWLKDNIGNIKSVLSNS